MKKLLAVVVATLVAVSSTFADNVVVKVTDDRGLPVQKADVYAILKSGAHQHATLDAADGTHKCAPTEQCIKIFVAAPNYEGVTKKYSGSAGVFTVAMKPSAEKSSSIARGWASLPGIEGSVSLNYSSTGKYSMDAGKMAFDEKKGGRPVGRVSFDLNRAIDMRTNTGQRFKIWVVDIMPQVALLEYSTPK